MKKTIRYPRFCSYACSVLLLILLVSQFLPFWQCSNCKTCGENGMISVATYIWRPEHHEGFTQSMVARLDSAFRVADVVLPHVMILVFGVLAIFFSIKDVDKPFPAVLTLIAGLSGVAGYALIPGLQLGLYWQVHLFLSVLILHLSASSLTFSAISAYEEKLSSPSYQKQALLKKMVREQKKQRELPKEAVTQ